MLSDGDSVEIRRAADYPEMVNLGRGQVRFLRFAAGPSENGSDAAGVYPIPAKLRCSLARALLLPRALWQDKAHKRGDRPLVNESGSYVAVPG